jgi:hypothetical protein
VGGKQEDDLPAIGIPEFQGADQVSTQPKPTIAAIDADIRARFGKTMGKFGSFFLNWIKFEDNSDKLYHAIGEKGENYLQFKLGENDVLEALVVLEVAKSYWEQKQQGKRVFTFLNHGTASRTASGITWPIPCAAMKAARR